MNIANLKVNKIYEIKYYDVGTNKFIAKVICKIIKIEDSLKYTYLDELIVIYQNQPIPQCKNNQRWSLDLNYYKIDINEI